MPVEIRVPPLGESVLEATVGKWLKQEGDPVAAGEPVVELETEKVNVEVTADQVGTIGSIVASEGTTVHPGDVLGMITELPEGAVTTPPKREKPEPAPPASAVAESAERLPPTSPAVRRIAAEHGIDLSTVQGTGPGGRVTKDDINEIVERQRQATASPPPAPPVEAEAKAEAPGAEQPSAPVAPPGPPPAAPSAGRPEERVRLSRRRLTIARRLVDAQQTAAQLTTFNDVDMSAVLELRRRRGEEFRARHDIGLGLMSFFTKAAVAALRAFPMLNAEIQGDEAVYKKYYDIGIAVATDEGLVVPVVRDADRKSFAAIEREIEDFAVRARENRLTLQDLMGGTFTITNGGVFGSLLSTPILNFPQVGILGMHRFEERPVASNGEVVIRPMMYLALSYDHRLVDGREAVLFLRRVKDLIEDPEALLLEG